MHLTVKVGTEFIAVDHTAVFRFQLLAVKADEECAHIVEQLVDPCEVDQTLIYSLSQNQLPRIDMFQGAVLPLQSIAGCGTVTHTTKMRPRSFAAVHFKVYPSFLYVGFEPASSD